MQKMHKLLIMDELEGHAEVEFAPPDVKTKEAEVSRKKAEAIFNEVMARPGKWTFLATAPEAVEGETLKKFNPHVEEAIAIAPRAGG